MSITLSEHQQVCNTSIPQREDLKYCSSVHNILYSRREKLLPNLKYARFLNEIFRHQTKDNVHTKK